MKDLQIDIITGKVITINGDYKVNQDATEQHHLLILLSSPGQWKEFPLLGVGLNDYILDDGDGNKLQHEIQEQLERDGATVKTLFIDDQFNIELEAPYISYEKR